jgi:hypothetical protein
MKRIFGITVMVLLLLLIFLSWHPANTNAGTNAEDFVIEGADDTNTMTLNGSSGLNFPTDPRFVIQYANAKNIFPFTEPPPELIELLRIVEDRFVIQYANAKHVFPLTTPPSELIILLQSVADRFVLQYANATNTFSLLYPIGLVGDNIPPVIEDISIDQSEVVVTVTVQTNEYTLAQLDYGLASGVYTETIIDDEFKFVHVFTITLLQSDTVGGLQSYPLNYYQVTVTDRSGNSTQSSEGILNSVGVVYLPLVVK